MSIEKQTKYRWFNDRVQIKEKHYTFRKLMERPREPKYRQGDRKQSYTKERGRKPIGVIEYGGERITGDKLARGLRTLEAQKLKRTQRRRRAS